MKIPLIKPYITESIKQRVCDVLDSGYLTEGPVTREFENKLKNRLQACRDWVSRISRWTFVEQFCNKTQYTITS